MNKQKESIMKHIIWISIIIIVIFGCAVGVNLYIWYSTSSMITTEKEALQSPTASYDIAMILGAGIVGNRPSPMLAERLDTGIALYRAKVIKKLLISGDSLTKEHDEISVMEAYLIQHGISKKDIMKDHYGYRTYASMHRARNIFNISKMIVITQNYHLHRAVFLARSLGIKSLGISCDTRVYSGQTMRDMREFASRIIAFYQHLCKPPLHRNVPDKISLRLMNPLIS